MDKMIKIGNRIVGKEQPTFVVAEMSGNHNMDYSRAERIIREAKRAGVDAIKLQTYTADTITLDSNNPEFMIGGESLWKGQTLYELYKKAYTPWEWQPKLKALADELGVILFSSPFDESAVDFLEEIDVPAYKIASLEISDIGLIKKCAETGKPIIISTGIASLGDIELALTACLEAGNDKIILLKCTTEYPASYKDMNITALQRFHEMFGCQAGLSDHSLGDEVAIAAVSLGACMIEKHFTLKRSDGGVDSMFSMEPDEMKNMIKRIRNVEAALGNRNISLFDSQKGVEHIGRSLYVTKNIARGEKFTKENVRSVRPGLGLHTKYKDEVLGKVATRDLDYAHPLNYGDVEW